MRLPVRRRHVIYVQGYDPRGLAQYYRMFRSELRKFEALYGIKSTIERPTGEADRPVASWTIETSAEDWRTVSRYDFLHWEDLIIPDFARPIWWTIGYSFYVLGYSILSGGMLRMWRAHWRFVIFLLYPFALFGCMVAAATGFGFTAGHGLIEAGTSFLLALFLGAGISVFTLLGLVRLLATPTYMLYLMADGCSTFQFANGQRPDWDARIDQFARHVVDVCAVSDADEVLIVGHSSGSFLAVEVLARALTVDADIGRRKPSVALLTLGANLPIVGYIPAAQRFRENLKRVAFEDSIRWVDCQSRKDLMNFFPYDPIAGHGLDDGTPRKNPLVVAVRFRDVISPAHYPSFRWKFFRVHFQFLMANERAALFDYFMMIAGPLSLETRFGGQKPARIPADREALAQQSGTKVAPVRSR
jgi:pimeloyl-ACP methyl ester carboxylesterase